MKILVISLLTTGFDPVKNNILELGFLVEQTENELPYEECPKLRLWADFEFYRGCPQSLINHSHVLQKIQEMRDANPKSIRLVKPDNIIDKLVSFLKPHFANNGVFNNQITVAGRNYSGLDQKFLERLKGFEGIPFSGHVIEPSILLLDTKKDNQPPTFAECKRRVGLEGGANFDSLKDCWDIVQIIRAVNNKKNEEFIEEGAVFAVPEMD